MKILIQISFLLFVAGFAHNIQAQIQQGSFRVGGSASYSRSKLNDENKSRQFSLSPSVAYFPVAKLSAGISINTSFNSADYTFSSYSSSSYSLGPQLRYYFPFGKWAVFPEVIYSFGKIKSESSSADFMGDPIVFESESNFSSLRGGVGLTYFVNPSIGVEGILSYQNSSQESSSPFSTPSESNSINFSIGFQLYLNRDSSSR